MRWCECRRTSTSTVIPRATACGCSNVCLMLLIGPKGILQWMRLASCNAGAYRRRDGTCSPETSELLQPMIPLALHERVGDDLDDLCAVGDAARVCAESGVCGEFRALEDFRGEQAELRTRLSMYKKCGVEPGGWRRRVYLLVVARADHEEAILAGEDLVRDDGRVRGAVSACFLACDEVVRRNVRQSGYL